MNNEHSSKSSAHNRGRLRAGSGERHHQRCAVGIPAGVYVATTYAAGPSAAERVDLLAMGVSWTLTVDADRNVVSHWHVESGNMVSDNSYTGIVHLKGNTATFDMYGAD